MNLAVLEARMQRGRRRLAIWTSLVPAMLIGLEEYGQRRLASRNSSGLDLAASYAGVIAFAWLALRIEKEKRYPLELQRYKVPGDFVCLWAWSAVLRVDALDRTGEWDGFADVLNAADPGGDAFDAHAEA